MNNLASFKQFSALSFSGSRFSTKEQTMFAKRMSFLVKAGVPLIESLSLIKKQTKSKQKSLLYGQVIEDVNNGLFLSTSLARRGNLFGEFAVNLIRVGEESGILSQNLSYLADELEKKDTLRRKVIGALVYPAVITVATLGITGVLTMYIFPKILPVFSSLHVALPLSTRMLIAISAFMHSYGAWFFVGLVAFGALFVVAKNKIEAVRYASHGLILRLPLFGKMMRGYNLANFCRTLGLLLRSGIQVSAALEMTVETTGNLVYKRAYKDIHRAVMVGLPISNALSEHHRLFPDLLIHMVAIGETTGNLSNALTYLSEMYEAEVEEMTKNLSSAIEPVLMVTMGVLVGFIAVSIITPIYEITQNLHG